MRDASAHLAPPGEAPPKTLGRLTAGDLYDLDGSANGPQALALLSAKNDARAAEHEAKQGREKAKKKKEADNSADGREVWRGVKERVASGEPNVLESLKVPELQSILFYLLQEKCTGKKAELQEQLRGRTKWRKAEAKGLVARQTREAAAAAEAARVAASEAAAGRAAGGVWERLADAADAGAGNAAGTQPGGRGRGGRGAAAAPDGGRGGRGGGRGRGGARGRGRGQGGAHGGGRARGRGRGRGGAPAIGSIQGVEKWNAADDADVDAMNLAKAKELSMQASGSPE